MNIFAFFDVFCCDTDFFTVFDDELAFFDVSYGDFVAVGYISDYLCKVRLTFFVTDFYFSSVCDAICKDGCNIV